MRIHKKIKTTVPGVSHSVDILCKIFFTFLCSCLHKWEYPWYIYLHRLDIGDGKEVDLKDCPRLRLQQECIKYLGPVYFQRSNIERVLIIMIKMMSKFKNFVGKKKIIQ